MDISILLDHILKEFMEIHEGINQIMLFNEKGEEEVNVIRGNNCTNREIGMEVFSLITKLVLSNHSEDRLDFAISEFPNNKVVIKSIIKNSKTYILVIVVRKTVSSSFLRKKIAEISKQITAILKIGNET